MKFDVTSKSVRDFADRVVKAHPELDKPKALEIASHGFGYRNFDTLSGVLKDASPKPKRASTRFKLAKPVTLWVEGIVCNDDDGSLDWVKVELTQVFLDNVLKRQAFCLEHGLLQVSEDTRPADWQRMEDIAIGEWALHVSAYRFWFRGTPKNCNTYAVESRAVRIDELLKLLRSPSDGDESFRWLDGALYKDANTAQGLFDVVTDAGDESDWATPSSAEDAKERLHDLEMSLHEGLDDDARGEILDEIAFIEAWLDKDYKDWLDSHS